MKRIKILKNGLHGSSLDGISEAQHSAGQAGAQPMQATPMQQLNTSLEFTLASLPTGQVMTRTSCHSGVCSQSILQALHH